MCSEVNIPLIHDTTNNTYHRHTYSQDEFDELLSHVRINDNESDLTRGRKLINALGHFMEETYCGWSKYSGVNIVDNELNHNNTNVIISNESKPKISNKIIAYICAFILHQLPFLNIMRHYNFRNSLIIDVVSGFTIGIMQIPQGMAYAMLATLPPVYGLYCSFFPSIFYFIFGTSPYISLGTNAILSLLVGGCLDHTYSMSNIGNMNSNNSSDISALLDSKEIAFRVTLASALALAVGIAQFCFGLCRLGFILRFLSDPLIAGFTVGSAVHVGMSQLGTILGLSLPKRAGMFKLPLAFYDICCNIKSTNIMTFGLSSFCIITLYIFKLWINPKAIRSFKTPIPIELFLVIFGAFISYQFELNEKFQLQVVGNIPTGLPYPNVPDITTVSPAIVDIFIIAIVALSLSFSVASLYAKKQGQSVDPNKELIAHGVMNMGSSFFHTFPTGASLSRSAVQVTMGAQSQIVGLVSAALVLFVLLYISQLLWAVPNCCLSAIILVALRSLFLQFNQLPVFWKFSKWDFFSWVITFFATAFLDVIYGLVIGLGTIIIMVILRAQYTKAISLVNIPNSELFKPVNDYTGFKEQDRIKIVRFEGSIYFACTDNFRKSIISQIGMDPQILVAKQLKLKAFISRTENRLQANNITVSQSEGTASYRPSLQNISTLVNGTEIPISTELADMTYSAGRPTTIQTNGVAASGDEDVQLKQSSSSSCYHCCCPCLSTSIDQCELAEMINGARQKIELLHSSVSLTHLILDFSALNFIDFDGLNALTSLLTEFNEIKVTVYVANVSNDVLKSLENGGFFAHFDRSNVFVSVYDAFFRATEANSVDIV